MRRAQREGELHAQEPSVAALAGHVRRSWLALLAQHLALLVQPVVQSAATAAPGAAPAAALAGQSLAGAAPPALTPEQAGSGEQPGSVPGTRQALAEGVPAPAMRCRVDACQAVRHTHTIWACIRQPAQVAAATPALACGARHCLTRLCVALQARRTAWPRPSARPLLPRLQVRGSAAAHASQAGCSGAWLCTLPQAQAS